MKLRVRLALVSLVMVSCGGPSGESSSTDSLTHAIRDSAATFSSPNWIQAPEDSTELPRVEIGYDMRRIWDRKPTIFQPFNPIYEEALRAYQLRDSLYFEHSEEFTPEDSALFVPVFNRIHESIQRYTQQLKSGVKTKKLTIPSRADDLAPEDKSHLLLRTSLSKTLKLEDFGFLGGAPFMTIESDVFRDANNNPEAHYTTQLADNSWYFFDYVYAHHPGPIETSFGPPLSAYESLPDEVNGIGSIVHRLEERIPVWFLTTEGAVPASLSRVNLKLGSEYGCISDNPTYTFACSRNIEPEAIFGVVYFANGASLEKATSSVRSNQLWEYDIDGDGQPDLARINSTFPGASDDNMAYAIWFVKLADGWVPLDYGAEPDCT